MLYLANKTIPLLICQPLPLAQVALLSEASQWVILVATQSPAQGIGIISTHNQII
jgi:hypothetical protein